MDEFFEQGVAMIARPVFPKLFAMVGGEDNQGGVRQAPAIESCEEAAELCVVECDLSIVERPEVANLTFRRCLPEHGKPEQTLEGAVYGPLIVGIVSCVVGRRWGVRRMRIDREQQQEKWGCGIVRQPFAGTIH